LVLEDRHVSRLGGKILSSFTKVGGLAAPIRCGGITGAASLARNARMVPYVPDGQVTEGQPGSSGRRNA
jgi:hypothetical protein